MRATDVKHFLDSRYRPDCILIVIEKNGYKSVGVRPKLIKETQTVPKGFSLTFGGLDEEYHWSIPIKNIDRLHILTLTLLAAMLNDLPNAVENKINELRNSIRRNLYI